MVNASGSIMLGKWQISRFSRTINRLIPTSGLAAASRMISEVSYKQPLEIRILDNKLSYMNVETNSWTPLETSGKLAEKLSGVLMRLDINGHISAGNAKGVLKSLITEPTYTFGRELSNYGISINDQSVPKFPVAWEDLRTEFVNIRDLDDWREPIEILSAGTGAIGAAIATVVLSKASPESFLAALPLGLIGGYAGYVAGSVINLSLRGATKVRRILSFSDTYRTAFDAMNRHEIGSSEKNELAHLFKRLQGLPMIENIIKSTDYDLLKETLPYDRQTNYFYFLKHPSMPHSELMDVLTGKTRIAKDDKSVRGTVTYSDEVYRSFAGNLSGSDVDLWVSAYLENRTDYVIPGAILEHPEMSAATALKLLRTASDNIRFSERSFGFIKDRIDAIDILELYSILIQAPSYGSGMRYFAPNREKAASELLVRILPGLSKDEVDSMTKAEGQDSMAYMLEKLAMRPDVSPRTVAIALSNSKVITKSKFVIEVPEQGYYRTEPVYDLYGKDCGTEEIWETTVREVSHHEYDAPDIEKALSALKGRDEAFIRETLTYVETLNPEIAGILRAQLKI